MGFKYLFPMVHSKRQFYIFVSRLKCTVSFNKTAMTVFIWTLGVWGFGQPGQGIYIDSTGRPNQTQTHKNLQQILQGYLSDVITPWYSSLSVIMKLTYVMISDSAEWYSQHVEPDSTGNGDLAFYTHTRTHIATYRYTHMWLHTYTHINTHIHT